MALIGSGGEDEQEGSRSGETEHRAQTDRAGALLSLTVCLSDQRLAVDAQMTAHLTTLQEQQSPRTTALRTYLFPVIYTDAFVPSQLW